jgi:hypothetical protein
VDGRCANDYRPFTSTPHNADEGTLHSSTHLKGRELANRCCADRRELIATAQVGSIRARRDPELLRSFLAGTGLTI